MVSVVIIGVFKHDATVVSYDVTVDMSDATLTIDTCYSSCYI